MLQLEPLSCHMILMLATTHLLSNMLNPTKRALMKKAEYLFVNGLAVPSSSAWSSPCLLMPKPDKTSCFCSYFHKANNITKADSHPLPRTEDCVDRVGAANFVAKLDLLKGYWQVPLTPRASKISAFITPDGFCQCTVMPFGLRTAADTIQRLLHLVLAGVNSYEVYLDDAVACLDTWSEHLKTPEEIFQRLKGATLTSNLTKCECDRATVTYLEKKVGQGQVVPKSNPLVGEKNSPVITCYPCQIMLFVPIPRQVRNTPMLSNKCAYSKMNKFTTFTFHCQIPYFHLTDSIELSQLRQGRQTSQH